MVQKYYIRKDNIITGPFERPQLIDMFKHGRLQMTDQLSADKISWLPPQLALDLIVPEKEVSGSAQPIKDDTPPVIVVNTCTNTTDNDVQDEDFTQELNFFDILLHVTASLGNGSGYLKSINQYSSSTVIYAGVTAAVLSLIFGISGCLLFGSCYNISTLQLCLITPTVLLFTGILFWLGNTLLRSVKQPEKQNNAAEADFLCAMHAMLNISVISVILYGTGFIFNTTLFDMTTLQISAVFAAALLPLIFFAVNIILSLRINFMGNCQLKAGTASLLAVLGFYLVIILSALLIYINCREYGKSAADEKEEVKKYEQHEIILCP